MTLDGLPDIKEIEWIRPQEILNKKYGLNKDTAVFIKDGAQANEIAQGALGDCWYIGSMSCLSNDDRYLIGPEID